MMYLKYLSLGLGNCLIPDVGKMIMKTVNLELSIKLKEAGYPQRKSHYGWVLEYRPDKYKLMVRGAYTELHDELIVADSPTADEMLDRLGSFMLYKSIDRGYFLEEVGEEEGITYKKLDKSLADAAAKLWLLLKKEGLIS